MRVLVLHPFGASRLLPCKSLIIAGRPRLSAAKSGVNKTSASAQGKQPEDFDSFRLDESYYEQVGITREEAEEDLNALFGEDPEHYQFPDDESDDEDVGDEEDDENESAWEESTRREEDEREPLVGPPALLLAGFRDHEFAMVRATIDSVGGHDVRVIPCRGQMLYSTVEEAWATPEPDWSAPKLDKAWSGSFGSQRTVIFSGLNEPDILSILELLEVGGMPPLMVALATEDTCGRVLGEIVAETIQEQRKQKQKAKPVDIEFSPNLIGRMSPATGSTETATYSDVQDSPGGPVEGIREADQGTTTAREAEPLRADSATKRQEADGFSVPASGVPRQEEPRASNGTAPLGESPDLQTNGWNGAAQRSQNGAMEQPSEAPVGSPGVADGGSLLEDNATMKATGNRFVSEIESSEFASEQRALREEAAQEMERRATAARAGSGDAMLPADNLIDAVAAGENLETMLKAGSAKPVKDVETLKAEREESARQKMEEVLERLKADATKLPEAERKKAAHELRMLSSDKEAIGKVLSEMGKDLDSIPKNDRSEVKSKLREEAWQPTRDAIGAALACGITADEVRGFVDEAELARAENRGGWYPKVVDTVEQ